MKLPAPRLLLALAAAPLLSPAGPDDRHGPARVTFYEHANFRGGSIVLETGADLDNLAHVRFSNGRHANDRISSIRIEGRAEVLVHTDCDYRGDVMRITHDIRDLGREDPRSGPRFNDRISSISIDRAAGHDRPGAGRPGPGRSEPVEAEKIIRRAYEDILGRAPDPAGLRAYRSHIIDRNWTEKMVRDSLRDSEEYRGPVTTRSITRVYRELLGREPDPQGLEDYRRRMIHDGWSENDVRESIRRSDEYRRRGH